MSRFITQDGEVDIIREGKKLSKQTAILKMEGDMTQYFGQTDMGEKVFAIYRKRYVDDLIYQEQWNPATSSWDLTTSLMRLLTGGDCTLSEIREADAMKAFPTAFPA